MNEKSMARQCDLPQIHSEFLDVNEKTSAIIGNIRSCLEKIKPIEEVPAKPSNELKSTRDDSFVSSMHVHLNFARKNAEALDDLLRHLSSLV